jgi:cytoskeletal protein CcmA (bactofilin family)
MASSDNSSSPTRPVTPVGNGFASGRAPILPTQPPRPAEIVRPGIERPPAAATPPRPNETQHRTLIVGREIALSGEITSCDRLVVEGSVQANLANCRYIEIAESGLFKGSASIEDAEIRGRFEGTLIARERLHIRATGKVSGKVSYAQVEIEAGGQLAGDVEVLSADASSADAGGGRGAASGASAAVGSAPGSLPPHRVTR